MKKFFYFILLIPFLFFSEVKADTFDNFEVTWYYRNKSNESQLLNVLKQEDVPLYASTSEYVNGYTTRVEQTFTKQIQYIVNYQLQMWFSPEQELNYRSDTLNRIIDYSYVDSDFKVLNTVASENWNRSTSGTGYTILTINVSMQVLALNNTNAIRFGVFTNNNISIGFYNHSDYINYYLVNNISIEENANATIIDQNNQIINGQNNLQNSITNSQDSINSNIDDMESAIVDSNKETQDVIKDQFNSCRPSNNLLSSNLIQYSDTQIRVNSENLKSGTYTFKYDGPLASQLTAIKTVNGVSSNIKYVYNSNQLTFTLTDTTTTQIEIYIYTGVSVSDIVNPMLNEGSIALPYEPYGEEVCSNRIDETNDALNNIGGALTDSSPTDMSGLGDSAGWLPPGPVDSIINLPLTFFLNLSQSLSSECRPVLLPLPFINKNVELPCMYSVYEKIGITGIGGFYTWVGLICSAVILFNYLLDLYHWVDKTLTMRENTMPGYYEDKWGGGA